MTLLILIPARGSSKRLPGRNLRPLAGHSDRLGYHRPGAGRTLSAHHRRRGHRRGQLDPYLPADADVLDSAGVEVHYLGCYLKWTPQENYYYAVEHIGFEANVERTAGTYPKYNSVDDKTDPIHYWTAPVKFGVGRATYDASQEIRNHRLTCEEEIALGYRYDQEFSEKYFPKFLEYLDMEEAECREIADGFRAPRLWLKTNEGWQLRFRAENP